MNHPYIFVFVFLFVQQCSAHKINKEDKNIINQQEIKTTNDSLSVWVNQRIAQAKTGKPELVQIAVTRRDDFFGCTDCSLFYAGNACLAPQGQKIHPIYKGKNEWEKPLFEQKSDTERECAQYQLTGYFSGKDIEVVSDTGEAEYNYSSNEFIILDSKEIKNSHRIENSFNDYFKVLNPILFKDFKILSNIELFEFKFYFDGNDFEHIYPELPKAQQILKHKKSDIEVLFAYRFSDKSLDNYLASYNINWEENNFNDVNYTYNPKDNSLFFSGLNTQTNMYLIQKKWLMPNHSESTETLTIESKVSQKNKALATEIIHHFSKQTPYK